MPVWSRMFWIPIAPDHGPLMRKKPPCDSLGLAIVLQHVSCVAGVIGRVATLLAHDAPQQFGEHGMIGDLRKSVVGGVGRPLIDGAPRHVNGGKLANAVAKSPEDDRAPEQVALVEPAHLDQSSVVCRPIVCGEHTTECLAVPILLVVPQREEGSELRVLPRGHQQQLTGVQHRLVFDVVHVREATQDIGVQWLAPEGIEVDVVGL